MSLKPTVYTKHIYFMDADKFDYALRGVVNEFQQSGFDIVDIKYAIDSASSGAGFGAVVMASAVVTPETIQDFGDSQR